MTAAGQGGSVGELRSAVRRWLLAALVVAALFALALALRLAGTAGPAWDPGSAGARSDRVSSWQEARSLAGTPLFEPDGVGGAQLIVRGVRGDPTRPVEARYPDGLVVQQAERDVLPAPDDPKELLDVPGADAAWRGEAEDVSYVIVRRGETLVLLSGRSVDDLKRRAGSLRSVGEPGAP